MQNISENQVPQSEEKKPYHAPTLKVYGDIRELTLANLSGGNGDSPGATYGAS